MHSVTLGTHSKNEAVSRGMNFHVKPVHCIIPDDFQRLHRPGDVFRNLEVNLSILPPGSCDEQEV